MTRSLRRLAVPALALLLAAPAAAQKVTGRILPPDGGKAVAWDKVQVELTSLTPDFRQAVRRLQGELEKPLATARPRPDGSFEIAASEPGLYAVTVRSEGFLPLRFELRPLIEETELPPAELEPASPVEVRVVGPDGSPVPGATVWTVPVREPKGWPARGLSLWQPAQGVEVTGPDGGIKTLSSPDGTLQAMAFSPRFGFAQSEVRERSATLRLVAARRVELEVRDARGKKVAGALVRLLAPPVPAGLTGPEGRLTLPLSEEAAYLQVETEDVQAASLHLARGSAAGPRTVTLAAPVPVSGRVVEADGGAPVPGALVWPMGRLALRPARTAADGRFRLQAPGTYSHDSLLAAAPGYLTEMTRPPQPSEEGGAPGPATLRLTRVGLLAGRVVDADGRPVAGARVRASSQGQGFLLNPSDLQAWSGADGGFRLRRLRAGQTYELTVDKEGFAPGSGLGEAAKPGSPAPPLRLVLSRGAAAFGKVVDESGKPVAGAEVEIRPVYEPGTMRMEDFERSVSAAAKADGSFELRPLTTGSFMLQARGPGFAPAYVPGIEVQDAAGRVDLGTITLSPEAVIEGQVTDPRGTPVAGARIETRTDGFGTVANSFEIGRSRPRQPLETGPDGRFRVGGLSPGTKVRVSAAAKGYAEAVIEGIEVPPPAPLRLELRPLGKLSGRVVDPAGEPVAGAFVRADEGRPGSRRPRGGGATDDQGRFQIDLEPGPVELSARAEGYKTGTWRGEVPERGAAGPAEIRLERGATLEGRVLDADGNPVGGARVSTSAGAPDFMGGLGWMGRSGSRSDGDGRYRLSGLETGVHEVRATTEDDTAETSVRFEVQPGANRLDLILRAGVEVSGHVRDDAGLPIAGAEMELFSMPGGVLHTLSAADGSFRFTHVPDGSHRLTARKRGLAPAHQELEVAGQPLPGLDIRLAAGGTITGRLLGLSPGDLEGIRIDALGETEGRTGVVHQDGTYRVRELAPGEWTVGATLASGRSARGEVRLEPGMTEAILDLDLGGHLNLSGVLRIDGAPVPGAMLYLSAAQRVEGAGGQSTTASDGSFRMTRLEPGTYTLSVHQMHTRTSMDRTVELAADQEVALEIATGTVQGQVLSPDGAPVALARLFLIGTHGEWSVHSSAHTDGRGRFELRLPAGEYKVMASSEAFNGEAQVQVPAGVSNIQVQLQPAPR